MQQSLEHAGQHRELLQQQAHLGHGGALHGSWQAFTWAVPAAARRLHIHEHAFGINMRPHGCTTPHQVWSSQWTRAWACPRAMLWWSLKRRQMQKQRVTSWMEDRLTAMWSGGMWWQEQGGWEVEWGMRAVCGGMAAGTWCTPAAYSLTMSTLTITCCCHPHTTAALCAACNSSTRPRNAWSRRRAGAAPPAPRRATAAC